MLLAATSSHGWTEHLVSLTGLDHTITEPPTGGGVTCEPKQPGVPLQCHPVSPGPPVTVAVSAVLPRVGEWQIADVTGDGIPDLVHAGPGPWGTPGVLVLAGSASGYADHRMVTIAQHRHVRRAPEPAGLAPRGRQRRRQRRPGGRRHRERADLHPAAAWRRLGAGAAGLRHTTTSPPHLTAVPAPVRPLHPQDPVLVEATGGDDGAWQPADVNGDGDQDLARVITAPSGQLDVEELISLGNGDWQPGPVTAIPTAGLGGFLADADDEDWHATDLDLDGRSDLVKATESDGTLQVQHAAVGRPGRLDLSQARVHRGGHRGRSRRLGRPVRQRDSDPRPT